MADDHMGYHYYHHFQLLVLISCCLVLCSHALQFRVGDQEGWVVNPSEKYNDWAGRLRFQVNDTLLFKYSKGDSVLVVNRDDYYNCNTDKPIKKFDDGNTVFEFDRSGPFYFITGNKDNCKKGQKMIIVVLAIRNLSPPPGQSPSPSTSTSPSPSPSTSPSPAPRAAAPSPASQAPVPSPSEGFTPATAPVAVPEPAPETMAPSPSSSPPPSSVLSPPSPTPGPGSNNTPSDIRSPTSPPGGSSATPAFTTSAALFSTFSLVLYGGLVIFI